MHRQSAGRLAQSEPRRCLCSADDEVLGRHVRQRDRLLVAGTATGTLYAGTNYVFCKKWGPEVRVDTQYNHYWMLTDLDSGNPWQNQYVSAYYLFSWGNDEAKDNNGTVLPNCP